MRSGHKGEYRARKWASSALIAVAAVVASVLGGCGKDGVNGKNGRGAADCVVAPGESIQQCVDGVLAGGGGTVLLLAGKHVLTSYVHIHGDDLVLGGEGSATVLYLSDATNTSAILVDGDPNIVNPDGVVGQQPIRNVSVRSLFIDMNKAGQTGEKWRDPYGHINMSGITIRYATNVTVRDVLVARAPSAGILVEKTTTAFVLDGIQVSESEMDGFSCNKSYQGQVVNSRLVGNIHAGFTATCDCSDNIVSNNSISGNGAGAVRAPGIYFAEAHRNLVADNIIKGNTDSGIILAGADCGVTPTGASLNYFVNNRITDNTGSCGVFLTPPDPNDPRRGPGVGNVATGTFYSGNSPNGICNANSSLYEDLNPIVP
jgi:parallel beta-helix repeat protein